jgi:DNA-binding CsgD family transcriptional regulator
VTAEAVRSRIERISRSADDALSLRLGVLSELARVAPFDGHVWLLTDPETTVGVAPLAAVPSALLPKLPQVIALKYLTEAHRWTGLDGRAVRLSAGDPSRSRLWDELLREHGVTDVALTVLRDRYGCWGLLDLWRVGGTFTDAELSFVDSVTAGATAGLRRCQAATFTEVQSEAQNGAASGAERPGPVVLVLSPTLDVLGQTPETAAYLRLLVPPEEGATPIPASAYNVAAQLLAVEAGVDGHPALARVHLAHGRWLSLRAARLGREGQIAVTIEDASPTERMAIFVRAHGLSAREAELLGHLMAGLDTRDAAGRMFVSEHTIQDHLKSVFAKTATRNRRALLARALGRG